MKYSILLPTRNGDAFLPDVIHSILSQDYTDFELIIADNANSDNTQRVIHSFLSDPRVKVVRSSDVLCVTDNWNNAAGLARGKYILLLGDDDYLLPGYFSSIDEILSRHPDLDCLLYNGYSYVAPGSISDTPLSFYNDPHFVYPRRFQREKILTPLERRFIVSKMFSFKACVPLNIQTTLFTREAFGRISDCLFIPPFPDHYLINCLLLTSAKCVVSPLKQVIVGISPKSFGHFIYSDKESDGFSYLGVSSDFDGRLPGNELLNGMHIWLELLLVRYPSLLRGIRIDRSAYVRRHVYTWFTQYRLGIVSVRTLIHRFALLSFSDFVALFLMSLLDQESWVRLYLLCFPKSSTKESLKLHGFKPLSSVSNIRQFASWLKPHISVDII